MTYYPTLDEDLARAKEILEKGKHTDAVLQKLSNPESLKHLDGGAIYGADIYAAYKLLESFVETIEAMQVTARASAAVVQELRGQLALLLDPFDHNGECRFCDEPGAHADDCAWVNLTLVLRSTQPRDRDVPDKEP